MWKVNFVDDAVAEREPDAGTAMIRSADAVLALDFQRGSIPGAPKAMEFFFIGYNSLP